VLIAGGGVAGLETLLGLRALAGPQVDIELLSREPEFVCRPVTVAEPFGFDRASRFGLDAITRDQGARLRIGSLRAVEATRHRALTAEGAEIEFDFLVVAAGARSMPGLRDALSFGGPGDVDAMRETMAEIGSSRFGSVAFALPPGIGWPVPLYELALLAGTRVNAKGASGVMLTLVTCEEQPLELFGAGVADAVRALLTERGVRLRTASRVLRVERGRLLVEGGGAVPADRVITLSRLVGPEVPGLAHDESGFIPTDRHGRVQGAADVYAAGDVTTFPLKQGGIAAQQADAVCRHIAARLGAAVQPREWRPVVRGLLLTGADPMRLGVEPDVQPTAARGDVEGPSGEGGRAADASSQEPEWHPTKIFGRHLGPYLARAQARRSAAVESFPGRAEPQPAGDDRAGDPLSVVLTMAEHDARCGDHGLALHLLDAAEAVSGPLPPSYQQKRSEWLAELGGRR
jgi:sulfide:quinone oxidoreductase